jgi:hypothetical protein
MSEPAIKRRMGRPPKPTNGVKRYPLSLRVTKDIKDDLASIAKKAGRSISAEVEIRLQQSLDRKILLEMVREAVRK